MKHCAYLALGANLGEREQTLERAIEALSTAVDLKKVSSFYQTSPVDSSGPDYVNAVVLVETTLSANELLRCCQRIEQQFGRVRPVGVHNAPRTLDIDVLTYDNVTSTDPLLTLPHPRMTERLFVMVPLAEIDPTWQAPNGRAIAELIAEIREHDPSQQIQRCAPSE